MTRIPTLRFLSTLAMAALLAGCSSGTLSGVTGPCDGVDCSGHGDCVADTEKTYHCSCTTDYSGAHCETDMLAAPSQLTATAAVSSMAINLVWTDVSPSETGFSVERAPDNGGAAGTFTEITAVGTNTAIYQDTVGLAANTRYYYRVRAIGASRYSAYSNEASDVTGDSEIFGWQVDETNTGLKGDYTSLTEFDFDGEDSNLGYLADASGPIVIFEGVTVTNKIFRYGSVFTAANITIDHCLIKPNAGTVGMGMPVVSIDNGSVIRDSELDCDDVPLDQIYMSVGISGSGSIYRSDIHGMSTGIKLENSSSITSVAEGNFIHGLRYQEPAHIDGLTIRESSGTGGIIVRNNHILVEPTDVTGPLFIQAQGYVDNVLVQGNLLQGHGTCLALSYNEGGYGSNMRAINNRIDAWTVSGSGPWTHYVDGPGWGEWSENYFYDANNPPDCAGEAIPE